MNHTSIFSSLFRKQKQILLFIVLYSVCALSFSQEGKFVDVFGQLTSSQSNLNGVEIKIKEDAKPWLNVKFNKRNGEFNLALPLNHTFLFKFSQPGMIEKQIEFSTFCHQDYYDVEFAPFFFMVQLEAYTKQPELDTLFYNQPVGKIFFSEEFIKFDYNRDYNLFVKNKIKDLKQKIEAREILLAQAIQDSIEQAEQIAIADSTLVDDLAVVLADTVIDNTLNIDSSLQIATLTKEEDSTNAKQLVLNTIVVTEDTTPIIEVKPEITLPDSSTKLLAENKPVKPIEEKPITPDISEKKVEPNNSGSTKKEDISAPAKKVSPVATTVKTPRKALNDPKPVSMGKANGKEFAFKEYDDKQVTIIYVTSSRRTLIYSMYQYFDGKTKYYKQQPYTNDSIQISRDIFTRAIR